jgi:hypothetical protein
MATRKTCIYFETCETNWNCRQCPDYEHKNKPKRRIKNITNLFCILFLSITFLFIVIHYIIFIL